MNSVAISTEKCPTNGNPLSVLRAVGGRIAQSLKTTALSVVNSQAGMFAGLSMLTAAWSGTALATEVVLRDTIHDTPATTLDSVGQGATQFSMPAPNGPIVSAAVIVLDLPANKKCTLKSFSFVFACKAGKSTPGVDPYSSGQLFNGLGSFNFSIQSGTLESLVDNVAGDYTETLTPTTFSSVMPWGSSTNNPYSNTKVLPLFHGTITPDHAPSYTTGPNGQKLFIKPYTVSDDTGAFNRFLLMYAKGATNVQDVAIIGGTEARYVTPERIGINSSAFATEFTLVVEDLPVELKCTMEKFGEKWAVCWDTVFGTNFTVQRRESFTTGEWLNLTNVTINTTEDGKKNFVIIPTNSPTAFFRLRSR
jgi:hypothetical protein